MYFAPGVHSPGYVRTCSLCIFWGSPHPFLCSLPFRTDEWLPLAVLPVDASGSSACGPKVVVACLPPILFVTTITVLWMHDCRSHRCLKTLQLPLLLWSWLYATVVVIMYVYQYTSSSHHSNMLRIMVVRIIIILEVYVCLLVHTPYSV